MLKQDDLGAYTVKEFCLLYKMTRPTFYKMLRAGKAPKNIKVGRKRLIARSSIREWERQHFDQNA